MHLWSTAHYAVRLPPGHRFPMAKYDLLRQAVLAEGLATPAEVRDPARVAVEALELVHTADWVRRVTRGELTPAEIRRLGFPWSAELVERSYRAVGGTCAAAEAALDRGVAMNLAGGTHHAFPAHGEGFCVFNDVAVAVRQLQHRGRVRRAVVIDLDVHQGNGTHAIFAGDASVYTFSMHGGRNYPYALARRDGGDGGRGGDGGADERANGGYGGRVDADLDVPLPDGIGDAEYLSVLAAMLPRALAAADADLAVYLAGADPHEGDRLGRMRLTFDGLARRDALVLATCREVGLPVAITIAGGYGADVRDTVRVHVNTVRVAREFAG